jgi:hypothetical protein
MKVKKMTSREIADYVMAPTNLDDVIAKAKNAPWGECVSCGKPTQNTRFNHQSPSGDEVVFVCRYDGDPKGGDECMRKYHLTHGAHSPRRKRA